jgi:hypothetical protein
MLRHISFGQFDSDGEYTNGQNDTSKFESDIISNLRCIVASPTSRVENICSIGANNDAEQKRPACFTDVKLRIEGKYNIYT